MDKSNIQNCSGTEKNPEWKSVWVIGSVYVNVDLSDYYPSYVLIH